jgi:hypothetical protein
MFKKLPNFLLCIFAALPFTAVNAQDYVTMPISGGFNADVIANGVGAANTSTTHTVDADDYVFMANNWQQTAASALPAVGLPSTGVINSVVAATSGLSYQLGPLSGNNALRLDNTSSGTVTFTTPTPLTTLYMLGATGNGPATVTVNVTFSDGTIQPFTGTVVPDWFNITTPPFAISGFGRLGRTSNVLESPSGNPRLYQIALAISTTNQAKNVSSVQVVKTTAGGVVSIFAFSGNAYTSCPAPTNIAAISTLDGATVTWTAPASAPSSGYEYIVTTSPTTPSATATPSGTVAAGITTKTLTGLITGQFYYLWIRSNCGTTKGFWRQISFYAGQITATYTTGDISSLYSTAASLTPTSTTTCPGTMSVIVPAGYKIKTLSTIYNATSLGGAFMSEQRSLLYCTTSSLGETALYAGVGNAGTYTHNRTNIPIANNLTGTVNFELRSWRVFGGSGCNLTYVKIDNNTWKINAVLESLVCTTPATPSATAQTLCPSALFSEVVVNAIPGAVYKWYTQPTGGTALTITDQIFTGTFYLSQTVGTCESARSTGFVITASGTATPTAVAQTYCGGTNVSALQTTNGTNVKWYAALTGGSPLAASTPLATGNYFVSQTLNNCESARATVAITVDTVVPPTVTSQVFCVNSGATVANLQATLLPGATVRWYVSDTATTPLVSTTALGSGTYYASQVSGICESVRVPSDIAVATIVTPNPGPQQLCTGATVANLAGGGSQASVYKWFATQDSTTQLPADTVLASGTYYVTQTLGGCESARASSLVTINDVTAPVVADQEFCAGATVVNLQATPVTGATIRWYATETSTTPLAVTAPLATGTYYVSQKLNNCESGRDAVAVTIHEVVPAPGTAPQLICTGSTLADVPVESAEGATVNWYASNTATVQLPLTTPVVSGTTYFASQTLGTCESARASVAVTFNYIAVPTSESFIVCNGTTFAELEVEGSEGATFNWYATIDVEDQLDAETVVTPGTFYVSQNVDGCESGRVAVATAIITTTAPSPTPQQAFCGEALVSDLVSGTNTEYSVSWYSPEGNAVAEGDVLVTGTYTVSQTANGCESQAMPVVVVITDIPDAPAGADEQDFTAGETVSDLDLEFADGALIEWYFFNEDVWISIPTGTPLVDEGVYGVQQTIGTCESEIKAVTVNLVLDMTNFELSNLNIYPNPSSDIVNIDGKETLTTIVVINLLGQQVLHQNVNAASAQINIGDLPRATYILQVYGANGGTATYKIVKQ